MKQRTSYTTKQGKAILEYMASLNGAHVTVNKLQNISKAPHSSGMGLTTIYRNLDKFVKTEGVRKYIIDGVSSACYQYSEESSKEHFHLNVTAAEI